MVSCTPEHLGVYVLGTRETRRVSLFVDLNLFFFGHG